MKQGLNCLKQEKIKITIILLEKLKEKLGTINRSNIWLLLKNVI